MAKVFPDGVKTTTVTGRWLDTDLGLPCSGTVMFVPDTCTLTVRGSAFVQGPVTAELNPADGTIRLDLPCSSSPGVDPSGFTYTVIERISCATCARIYHIQVPCDLDTVDLSELAPADPSQGQFLPVQGPAGHTPELTHGTGTPTTVQLDGDLYLDDATGDLYQQKSGRWVREGNIRGPRGETGTKGDTGPQGPPVSIRATTPATVSGSGTSGDPYTVGVKISANPGNTVTAGTDGGLFADGNPVRMKVADCAEKQAIPSDRYMPWPWNNDLFETHGGWVANDDGSYSAPVSGLYSLSTSVCLYSDEKTPTTIYWGVFVNGIAQRRQHTPAISQNYQVSFSLACHLVLKAGDKVAVQAQAQQTTAPSTKQNGDYNWLEIVCTGPAAASWSD